MRGRLWAVLALFAFGFALLPALPAAAGFGAIAWDRESGKAGWVWNQPTAKDAAAKALSECGASGCQLVIKPTIACAALAATANGKYIGAAARKTVAEARLAALADCKKGNAGECVVRASACNNPVPGQVR
jgi:hypothetical protein